MDRRLFLTSLIGAAGAAQFLRTPWHRSDDANYSAESDGRTLSVPQIAQEAHRLLAYYLKLPRVLALACDGSARRLGDDIGPVSCTRQRFVQLDGPDIFGEHDLRHVSDRYIVPAMMALSDAVLLECQGKGMLNVEMALPRLEDTTMARIGGAGLSLRAMRGTGWLYDEEGQPIGFRDVMRFDVLYEPLPLRHFKRVA
jgi:hypothetical protein